MIHPYEQLTSTDCPKCKCLNFKTVYFSLKQLAFRLLFHYASAVLRYHLCSTFSLEKKMISTLLIFYYFVDPRRLKKFMLMH